MKAARFEVRRRARAFPQPPQQDLETQDLFEAVREAMDVPIDLLAECLNTTRGALYKTIHDARRKLGTALTARRLGIGDTGAAGS